MHKRPWINPAKGGTSEGDRTEKAIAKAEEYGMGWVSVKDSGHFGVAGLYPVMALEKDFIGYVVSNSAPMMFPWGGKERIIGNNPLAYAIPADRYPPVVLDFSLSVVSSGKLILTRKKGEKIPLGSIDAYIREIKESARARGTEEILVPGEPEFRTEARLLKEGIPLSGNTVKELTSLGESLGVSLRFMD